MGHRPNLYIFCALLFPLALAGFSVGFGCPVWAVHNNRNYGLWQNCGVVLANCTTMDFYDVDYHLGTRAVEIAAAALFVLTTFYLLIENCVSDFQGRPLIARLGAGLLSILGGMAGLAGIITFAVKTNQSNNNQNLTYGWALALNAAGSGLAIVLGVGLCLSGTFFETAKKEKKAFSQTSDSHEMMAYSNHAMTFDDIGQQTPDSTHGYAVYNGHVNRPGSRSSLLGPSGPQGYGPSMYHTSVPANGEAVVPRPAQHFSYLDDGRQAAPGPGQVYDLSEGYKPVRPRSASPRNADYLHPVARPPTAMSYPGYLDEPVGRTAFRNEEAGYTRAIRPGFAADTSRAHPHDDYYRGGRY